MFDFRSCNFHSDQANSRLAFGLQVVARHERASGSDRLSSSVSRLHQIQFQIASSASELGGDMFRSEGGNCVRTSIAPHIWDVCRTRRQRRYLSGASRLLPLGLIRCHLPIAAQASLETISQRALAAPGCRAEALAASAREACSARRS
jgi:hypothetical protein